MNLLIPDKKDHLTNAIAILTRPGFEEIKNLKPKQEVLSKYRKAIIDMIGDRAGQNFKFLFHFIRYTDFFQILKKMQDIFQ